MKKYILPLILFIALASICMAQEVEPTVAKQDSASSDFKFAPIPYMSYDRTLGLSVGALPMMMYRVDKQDTISPQSVSGAMGFYTTNESWFAIQFNKLHLKEDKWRVMLGAGIGSFNYQFYLESLLDFDINRYIDYQTDMKFLFVQGQRKVIDNLYLGLNLKYVAFDNTFDVLGGIQNDTEMYGLGMMTLYDKRDDVYYAREGFLTDVKYNGFPKFMGNDSTSHKIEISYNHYLGMRQNKDVLAMRFYGGFGLGDVEFNQQLIIGNSDIRGYTQGQYRGDQLAAVQAEYRWNPHEKISGVGFVGVATVFNSINASDNGKLRPGAGVGFRYLVFPDSHMNVGLDAAVGKEDWGVYFRIGEAF